MDSNLQHSEDDTYGRRRPAVLLRHGWRRIRGCWVLRDREAADLLGLTAARMNKIVRRRPDRFPPDFAFQLSLEEWERHYRYGWGGSRRSGRRAPWVYSGAGILQMRWMAEGAECLELVRWLARVLPAWRFPAPKAIGELMPEWQAAELGAPARAVTAG